MEITVLAVGRNRDAPCAALFDDYGARLPWALTVVELVPRRGQTGDAALLGALPRDAVVVALDELGRDLSSRQLATTIGGWREEARTRLAFLIGGPDGHGDGVRARADLVLSLGRMTWPHRLVRVMLAEQLYRAATILSGHPYHRD